jgi:hypothetical protein
MQAFAVIAQLLMDQSHHVNKIIGYQDMSLASRRSLESNFAFPEMSD